MKKNGTRTIQFHPYLRVNNERIPTLKEDEEFVYLGKKFTMNMKTVEVENELSNDLREYAEAIHRTPLHPKNKIIVVTRYVYSKIRWRLSTYDLSVTWVKQNLDSIVTEYLKRWLNLHQGANTRHLFLPTNKLGIKVSLPSHIFKAAQLVKRSILKSSSNQEIRDLYKITVKKYIEEERLLQDKDRKSANSTLNKETMNSIINEMSGLKEQNTILTAVRNYCTGKVIDQWNKMCESLSANTYKFARKALIFSLPINNNLKRWKKIASDLCILCSKKQTQLHVLNNCSTAANDGRYEWRHNSILYTISIYVQQLAEKGFEIFIDLPGHRSPNEVFTHHRPDIVLRKQNQVIAIELTCCFESNVKKSNTYKVNRYRNIQNELDRNIKLTKFFVEVTSLGFIPRQSCSFFKLLQDHQINTERLSNKMSETALRCSYYLYTQRNKNWNNCEILKFY